MIYRYADYKDLALPKKADKITFKDADKIGSWAKEAVAAMQQANIIGGYPDGTFLPKNQASRAEAAKMISVFLKEATAKGVTEETYQDFMDKDVKDFEADRVLNFDASLADKDVYKRQAWKSHTCRPAVRKPGYALWCQIPVLAWMRMP